MYSQKLTPKHANPPGVGGSPRDGRHPIRPPATESTLKQIGTEPICFPGCPKSDLGSNMSDLAVSRPKRTTVRAPKTPSGASKNPTADGSTEVSTERAPLPCCLADSAAALEYAEIGEMLEEGLPAYLQKIQNQIAEAALAVQKSYFLH